MVEGSFYSMEGKMYPSKDEFLAKFDFSRGQTGRVGLEDETYVAMVGSGILIPRADEVLRELNDARHYSCELTRTQVEHNTGAYQSVRSVVGELMALRDRSQSVARQLDLVIVTMPVAPVNMPQDITPNNERYARMAAALREKGVLLPALRVSSLQPNISCNSWSELLECYNRLVKGLDRLVKLGDRSNGERMRLYAEVVEGFGFDPTPKVFNSPDHMYELACEMGWADDPNSYHPHIRIKPSTETTPPIIEVRPLDAIEPRVDIEEALAEVLDIAGFSF